MSKIHYIVFMAAILIVGFSFKNYLYKSKIKPSQNIANTLAPFSDSLNTTE